MNLELTDAQRNTLLRLRDHDPRPYMRERAGAILKVADGISLRRLAKTGLLRHRAYQTISCWVKRFLSEGEAGLLVRAGRGRKPAFSPLDRERPGSSRRAH
jgi:transposase